MPYTKGITVNSNNYDFYQAPVVVTIRNNTAWTLHLEYTCEFISAYDTYDNSSVSVGDIINLHKNGKPVYLRFNDTTTTMSAVYMLMAPFFTYGSYDYNMLVCYGNSNDSSNTTYFFGIGFDGTDFKVIYDRTIT